MLSLGRKPPCPQRLHSEVVPAPAMSFTRARHTDLFGASRCRQRCEETMICSGAYSRDLFCRGVGVKPESSWSGRQRRAFDGRRDTLKRIADAHVSGRGRRRNSISPRGPRTITWQQLHIPARVKNWPYFSA